MSGHKEHDDLIRDDFSYDYSPNVGLCIAICNLHTKNDNLAHFLIYYCQRLKILLRPEFASNEIDYLLVAQMLHVLAISAKKLEKLSHSVIIEHAEIVLAMVKSGCEKFNLAEELNINSLRKLCENLVKNEKFQFAVDLTLKSGLSRNSVLATWGISCLKVGMFETAREKLGLCLTRIKDGMIDDTNLIASIDNLWTKKNAAIKSLRPLKSSSLLIQVQNTLEKLAKTQKTGARKQSRESFSSNLLEIKDKLKRKEVVIREPASIIKNSLDNLKEIAKGNYSGNSPANSRKSSEILMMEENYYYKELMFYLINYGGHIEIIKFLMEHNYIKHALKYYELYKLDSEIFLDNIYKRQLEHGKSKELFDIIRELNSGNEQKVWRNYIFEMCRFLLQNKFINSLYNFQVMLKDPIRAAMTCVR